MFKHNLTLYSKYIENRVTKYKKSFIKGVHWQDSQGVNVLKSGLSGADKTTVYIPLQGQEGLEIKVEDIIVKGLIDEEIKTIKELEEISKFTRTVTSVDIKDYGSPKMQHIRIGAK